MGESRGLDPDGLGLAKKQQQNGTACSCGRKTHRVSLAEADEILDCLGHYSSVKSHDDSPRRYAVNFDVEKDLVRYRGLSSRTKQQQPVKEEKNASGIL